MCIYSVLSLACIAVLLTESGLPDPKSYEATGWLVVGLSSLIIGVYYVLLIWKMLFPAKSPPDHETYATKSEVAKLEIEHEEEMQRIEKRFEEWLEQQAKQHGETMKVWSQWRDSLEGWKNQIERAMGHVETKADVALQRAQQRK